MLKGLLGKFKGKDATPEQRDAPVPEELEQLINHGNQLEDAGQADSALELYEQAVANFPNSAKAELNKGNALVMLGRLGEAIRCFEAASRHDPEWAVPCFNLGNAHMAQGEFSRAVAAYTDAANRRQDWAEAWAAMGAALEASSDTDSAVAAYREALIRDPSHEGANGNLAGILLGEGQARESEELLRAALEFGPSSRLLQKLAGLYNDLKQFAEARECLGKAMTLEPDNERLTSASLFAMNFDPDISDEALAKAHFDAGNRLEARITPMPVTAPQETTRALRIGYLSPDFRRHPVSCFVEPVFTAHDRTRFEVHALSCVEAPDDITQRLMPMVDQWHEVAGLDNQALASYIRECGIDILIDLAGHTTGGRMGVLARKAAPLQVTWMGYLGTTGLTRVDHRICDAVTDLPGQSEGLHSERLIRLRHSQWCYKPQVDMPPVSPLPFLQRGYWTFGSFNQYPKLNPTLLETWASVLHKFANSRLLVLGLPHDSAADWLFDTLEGFGIDEQRIDVRRRISIKAYLESFSEVDVALDSFPYNGGTTSLDALINGVPVAHVEGQRSISRGGSSILTTLGLTQWIASSPKTLPDQLDQQLSDAGKMALLRAGLREKLLASPLMNAPEFTQDLEAQLLAAWNGRTANAS